jgi:hypothetical protein
MNAGAYSFLPWLRTGLSTKISDELEDGRATVQVQLNLIGDAIEATPTPPRRLVTRPVQLYGPGDVIGMDVRAISRTEPQPFTSNFEPNYLAHIEFYDEDIPWRYSPAAPDADTKRLAPWLALIVLSDGESGTAEFKDGALPGRPLPFITVTAPTALQPAGELGAWAHVHVNGALDTRLAVDDPRAMGTALSNLARVLRAKPDSACSRVICPRRLRPSTTYHAFLVPAFETGRRAGLGIVPTGVAATTPSWDQPDTADMPAPGQLPYYHRWTFTTSTSGDFEYLATLLNPFEATAPVGLRDMDAHRPPGFGLLGLTTPTEPDGVLQLGGALRLAGSDETIDEYENWDNYYGHQPPAPPGPPYPNEWQRALAGLINLAAAYQHQPAKAANTALSTYIHKLADEVDPVITPPLYGRWHALTPKLLTKPDGSPVSDVELHNWVHRLNLDPRYRVAAHFGTKVVQARQEELMAAAWQQVGDAPRANARIRAAQLAREVGNVLHGKHIDPKPVPVPAGAAAPLPSARALTLTAPAHPKVVDRPAPTALAAPDELLAVGFKVSQSRVATAPVSPAMRRITRSGTRLMKTLKTSLDTLVTRIDEQEIAAAPPTTTPPSLVTTAKLVDQLPTAGTAAAAPWADAAAYEQAQRELHDGWRAAEAAAVTETGPRLDVGATTAAVLAGLHADATVLDEIVAATRLPDRLAPKDGELTEVMAYPVFDMPMYKDLLGMSTDTFVPNLGVLPPNSVSLLENNRRFIESYLVGLNHEMAREMLWREYPTDQRGTPFRQFWDPRTAQSKPNETADERRRRLYDILPIHEWGTTAALGENDNRPRPKPGEPPRQEKSDLVLVIRGELLKKYPTAAIYAHKAAWPVRQDGSIDMTGERELAKLPPNEDPRDFVRLPIWEAKVEPDIYLLGFDLTVEQARGTGKGGDLGWFFVLEERPGDPRFGADEDKPGGPRPVEVWNDLTWSRLDPAPARGFIRFDGDVHVELAKFNNDEDDQEKEQQRADDDQVGTWHPKVSSADVAYILFQAPVLMAIHAQEMLPDGRAQS